MYPKVFNYFCLYIYTENQCDEEIKRNYFFSHFSSLQ